MGARLPKNMPDVPYMGINYIIPSFFLVRKLVTFALK